MQHGFKHFFFNFKADFSRFFIKVQKRIRCYHSKSNSFFFTPRTFFVGLKQCNLCWKHIFTFPFFWKEILYIFMRLLLFMESVAVIFPLILVFHSVSKYCKPFLSLTSSHQHALHSVHSKFTFNLDGQKDDEITYSDQL